MLHDSGLFAEVMEHALASGSLVRFRAEGRSMHPTIRDGEEITAAPVSMTEVVRGDVLLCRHAGRMLAHRVVGIAHHHGDRRFELRGDFHTSSDALVGADDIVARIVAVRRGARSMPIPGGWLAHRVHLATAWTRRTIVRAIDACRSVYLRAGRRRS